ncbi:hypothetical protein [Chryseobacterium kwangjuense]|uniref:Uncharacterized protein n=1 Tax=Chryseobacterium kwangjuense TaxID=267125 RepID=A0A135WJ53_9FLAO|nr:hypothetical protein [Chryseobacterium kwangjuense]KXH84900.1 hypothetical protein AU378_03855 [Chryseobacterium kwangjuense]
MRLEEIIKAIRINQVEELLGGNFVDIDFDKIIIYAEYSISADIDYKFFRSKRGLGEIIKDHNVNYERLCSIGELDNLIKFFLSKYSKKDDDILVIEVLDYLDSNNN